MRNWEKVKNHKNFIYRGSIENIICGKDFIQDGIKYEHVGHGRSSWGTNRTTYLSSKGERYIVRHTYDSKAKKYRIDRLFRATILRKEDGYYQEFYAEKHKGKYVNIFAGPMKKHSKIIREYKERNKL